MCTQKSNLEHCTFIISTFLGACNFLVSEKLILYSTPLHLNYSAPLPFLFLVFFTSVCMAAEEVLAYSKQDKQQILHVRTD